MFEEFLLEMSAWITTNLITLERVGIVAKQVESLKFGVVQITVHESRVAQIEKTENVRFDNGNRKQLPMYERGPELTPESQHQGERELPEHRLPRRQPRQGRSHGAG